MDYFKNQISEISSDLKLRIYGVLMSLIISITAIDWLSQGLSKGLEKGIEAICWPTFPECQNWRIFSGHQIEIIFIILLGLSIVNIFLFLKPNYIKAGFWLLLGLNILKLVIIAFDYRFRLNQHIMAFWLCATFLFIPKKVHSLKILILLFYFWSGLLKLNSEWLSGSAIYGHLWLSNSTILPWMCAYVVVLETIMIWCMVFDKKWLSWSVFIQLLIFHLFSYSVVGFYYPVLMTLALFIFPLSWILSPADSTWKWLVSKQASSYACLGLIILFSLLQLIPRLMPGDSALTGEGRFFALHMFDSKSQCETKAFIKGQGGLTKIVDLQINHPIRIHCDPITYLSRARYLCKNASKQDARFLDLDLIIRSRRSNESHLHEIVNITNFCAQKISYSLFSHNDWIHN